ncbi:MAG: transcriptional repressor [Tissierellia bacterium]|nr:transcriptional repressor [Tissierellia bacterium]
MKKLNNWEKETLNLIENVIDKNGYKATSQRREILYIFIKHNQKHLSAEEVYEYVKQEGIGLATVYRNIKIFVDLDILKEIRVDDTNYYELKMYGKKPLHIHFQCENCGCIEDILDQDIILEYLRINRLIEDKQSCEIFDMDIMFHGLCKDCIKE